MNGLTTHEAYALENLNDRTAWRAEVDHHEELLDVPRQIALRAVARMRFQERRRRELQRAAQLLDAECPVSFSLCSAIRAHFHPPGSDVACIYVVEGRRCPTWHDHPINESHNGFSLGSITVGARHVLKLHAVRLLLRELWSAQFVLAIEALLNP